MARESHAPKVKAKMKGEMMTTTKFEIRTGGEDGTLWGFARTMGSAAKRAEKLSRKIRTDIPVCIVADGKVIAKTGASSSGIAGFTRPLEAV